jgi:hypothetical protein
MKRSSKKASPSAQPAAWSAPEENWIPLHRAKLMFFPEFISSGPSYIDALRRFADGQPLFEHENITLVEVPSGSPALECGDLRLVVHPSSGELELEDISPGLDPDDWERCLFLCAPSMFAEKANMTATTSFSSHYLMIVEVGHQLIAHLRRGFHRGLRNGDFELVGRFSSPAAPFTRVYADQWRFFDEVDSSTFDPEKQQGDPRFFGLDRRAFAMTYEPEIIAAVGPNRSVIYSPHVIPVEARKQDSGRRRRQECFEELRSMIRSSFDRRAMTIPEINQWAQKRWGADFPVNEIKECFRRAKKLEKSPAWDRGGRPRKSTEILAE